LSQSIYPSHKLIFDFKESILNLGKNPSQKLLKDFIAAVTVSVMIIPLAMAYSVLEGFPSIYNYSACLLLGLDQQYKLI